MRRVLLLNALIFAVLAAAVALAYYGYSFASEASSRERELALMQELADEKVVNIDSIIDAADSKLLREVHPDRLADLSSLVRSTGAAVASVFVLDEGLELIPDGYHSNRRDNKESAAFREYFLSRVLPELQLEKQPLGVRGHLFFRVASTPDAASSSWYLFSFMRRQSGDRTFYVVIEDNLAYLVGNLFPQFLLVGQDSKRAYQVVDELGDLVFGQQIAETKGELIRERQFQLTVDGWWLRVRQRDVDGEKALKRKKLVDSVLIGGAITVIVGGLGFLGFAIRRERRLNELKSEFISNVSHELKTPLSIISMFGEMLAEGRTKSPEQAHEYAEIIWRESVRLGRLIDNVLDFAKIERGMGVYEFAETDIGEVVDRAVELSGRRVQAAEMQLSVDIEPDLPLVQLDANAFTLAVLNLIDNAIKYAADGKKIDLSLKHAGDRVVLALRDYGPGIEAEEQEKIFERFYRARSIRLKPIRGSGIGLALVQHIAKAHGGAATVASEPGKGATFSISLPTDGKS
ncbi:MAG: HAMP domain-containing sensor histidine kinase [Kofleriaceae bacterium]|nr:HAMP domain-containing sensor histidine kinase [Kofleriaceae bacterium]